MKLSHAAMQPADIPECADLLAKHPVIGPRYGTTIESLPQALLRLLESEAGITTVFRADEGSRAPICFFGVAAIVRDNFLCEMKTPPHFWIGPELTRRMVEGESPVLTHNRLREANARDGLNLVCWEGLIRPGYEVHSELQRYTMEIFIQKHRGYLWKEVISSQCAHQDHLQFVLRTGGHLWDARAGGYTSTLRTDPSEIVSKPHILGITRDLELSRQGNWAGSRVEFLGMFTQVSQQGASLFLSASAPLHRQWEWSKDQLGLVVFHPAIDGDPHFLDCGD